ncbi:MAG: septal ring lytic transglycosylase RlpA family protein [Acidobacteriota bacterium]
MTHLRRLAPVLLCLVLSTACATNRFDKPRVGSTQRGVASWYGEPFHGRATASGEIYDMHLLTAAHKELPLGTVVDVTNLDNGLKVRVRVNDRGPFIRGRVIDLSYGAAREVKMIGPGTAKVSIEIVSLGGGPSGPSLSTRFVVQAGAFRDATNARRLEGELARHHDKVQVVEKDGIHRVRLGPFRTSREAEDARQWLARRGHPALVIALN